MILSIPTAQSNPSFNQPVLRICGDRSLAGEVRISGSKNAVLPIMAAALLNANESQIHNVPHLEDVIQMGRILEQLGVSVEHRGSVLNLNTAPLSGVKAPSDAVQQLRAGFLVIAPLLARTGMAQVPLPGGCAIGSRPVDLHLRGLEAMGAKIDIREGVVHACLKQGHRLQGTNIKLDFPSVGATEALIMAAVLAEGETVIDNAAQEPEVADLISFCQSMGARISGAGTPRIIISGVSHLHATEYRVIPDRIEAGTFLVAAAITRSPLMLNSVNAAHLRSVVEELWAMGATVRAEKTNSSETSRLHNLRIIPATKPTGRVIKTRPYPGFPTDMQPQFMALLSTANDSSFMIETLFENRFQHVPELSRMGADIRIQGNQALIFGGSPLAGTDVYASDLRAGAALVLAALAAEGTTTIHNLHYLDRGYENLEAKLRMLGAKVERVCPPNSSSRRSTVVSPLPQGTVAASESVLSA